MIFFFPLLTALFFARLVVEERGQWGKSNEEIDATSAQWQVGCHFSRANFSLLLFSAVSVC
jgi:hypothetical protein